MRRLLNWLKSWWGLGRVSHQLSALDRRLDRLEKDRRCIEGRVESDWELIHDKHESISGDVARITELFAEKEALVKRYEEELDAARSKILTYEESTIPTLVAANATYKDMWDAISAEQIRRRVAAAPTQEGIG